MIRYRKGVFQKNCRMEDDRFKHISTDPRFRSTPKSIRKVKIDKRFQSLFTDKRFQIKYTVDKRGRPIDQSSSENLRKYYDLSSDEDSSSDNEDVDNNIDNKPDLDESSESEQHESNEVSKAISSGSKPTKTKKVVSDKVEASVSCSSNEPKPSVSEDSDSADIVLDRKDTSGKTRNISKKEKGKKEDDDQIYKDLMTHEIKMKLRDPKIDYARGVGNLLTDSSSDEESDKDSDEEDENLEHQWGELDRDAETTEEATSRLAALHMDWDRIRAVDLIVLFNSFLPRDGVIHSVAIYPSEFGQQRIKEEDERGPIELINMQPKEVEHIDEETKEGKKFHMERLRQYQLNRLKYYYAVITFDSPETAGKVYNECDGMEYESSSTKLDLRFVPEDETFDQEPREVCNSMPDPAKYEPRLFVNKALQQGKVDLTWDETDPSRLELNKKILTNADKVDSTDLQAYLAYSSDEDGGDSDEEKPKIKKEEEEDTDEENVDREDDKIAKYKSLLASLEEEEEKKKSKDVDLEITWGVGLKERAEKSIKEKLNAPQTPFEQMVEKRRQKKKLKREEKQKLRDKRRSDSNESSEDDIPSDVDLNDPYFKEELDGLKPNKKKKTPKNIVNDDSEDEEEKRRNAELELLMIDEDDKEKNKSHFNLKSIQEQESETKKKKKRKLKNKKPEVKPTVKDDFQIDLADERFSALYSSHHFNIDPTNPMFRKTKNMEALITEKLKRRVQEEHEDIAPKAKSSKPDPELSLLVKSVKNKTKGKR